MPSNWKRRGNRGARRPRVREPSALVRQAMRRRHWTRQGLVAFLLILALSVVLERVGYFGHPGNDWETFDGKQFIVTRVADGDTVQLQSLAGGIETPVRMIGVDTPEMNYGKGTPDYWAEEATEYAERQLSGRPVTVKLDGTRSRDHYDRLLAYLYADDSTNFNERLIREGHGYADRRFGHTFKAQFEQAETEARRKERGLWDEVTESQMPEWRRRWLEKQGIGRGGSRS